MPPVPISATLWRGGTSRALLLRASTLAPFPPSARNRIILQALGAPDSTGHNADGLAGSSATGLSNVAIVGPPGEGLADQERAGPLPGVPWADDGARPGVGEWDVVCRFAQVSTTTAEIAWTAASADAVAAVALAAVSGATPVVPFSTLFMRAKRMEQPPWGEPLLLPISILSACEGRILRARVPMCPLTLQVWEPEEGAVGGDEIEISGISPGLTDATSSAQDSPNHSDTGQAESNEQPAAAQGSTSGNPVAQVEGAVVWRTAREIMRGEILVDERRLRS